MATGERFNVNVSLSKNWEHLSNKFLGTGHPDISRHDFAVAHHRDTYATMLGHADLATTEIYTKVTDDRVSRAHAKHHPRG
jgi:site-specific recombinase XerD